jgi:NAD(P)H-dependent FMN reductase
VKILIFAGSLRKDSLNKKLCLHVKTCLSKISGIEAEFLDLAPLEIPVYNGDDEVAKGLPQGVQTLCDKISAADALVVSTPEYNGSIPGVLKNAIDWVSRKKPNPLAKKKLLLLAASPGALGGVRSLWHTRVPFEALGCYVSPDMLGLSKAHEAFSESGTLRDEKISQQLDLILKTFTEKT